MRQLHPRTIEILAEKGLKAPIAHCWSEQFKAIASGKKHPKVFINRNFVLGAYMQFLYKEGSKIGCNFDASKISGLDKEIVRGYKEAENAYLGYLEDISSNYFDDNYLFSDAESLYDNGINIFPEIFGDDWKKYVSVISYKERARKNLKTLTGEAINDKDMQKIVKFIKDLKITNKLK